MDIITLPDIEWVTYGSSSDSVRTYNYKIYKCVLRVRKI